MRERDWATEKNTPTCGELGSQRHRAGAGRQTDRPSVREVTGEHSESHPGQGWGQGLKKGQYRHRCTEQRRDSWEERQGQAQAHSPEQRAAVTLRGVRRRCGEPALWSDKPGRKHRANWERQAYFPQAAVLM